MRVNGGLLVENEVTAGGNVLLSKSAPMLYLYDTGAAADARRWRIWNTSSWLIVDAVNDAATVSQSTALTLYRTGDVQIGRRLMIGGNTSAFPGLRYGGTGNQVDVVLADGSAYAILQSLSVYTLSTGNSLGDLTVRAGTNFQGGIVMTGGAMDITGVASLRGEVNVTGGSGTGFSAASIEIMTTALPRVSFHWPGVVASQIGMDSAGTIVALDNPGTGYAAFTCANINCAYVYSRAANNNLADLTCRGATSFQAGLTCSNDHIKSSYYIYPGAITNPNVQQLSWYLATHSSYGLYTNTGIYVVGPVIGQVYNNHGGYYGFIHTHALTYANPNALDDYEEGDWTPTIEFASGDAAYAEQIGSYTKIGRMVFVCGSVTLSEKGTGIGRVAGLPFVPERRVTAPHYLPQLAIAKPTHFEFSYQAPT